MLRLMHGVKKPMKALLVIDVQDIYLKRYKDLSFIENINRKIDVAKQVNECIIYIQNVGPFKSNGPEYKFCDSLRIVSEATFVKKKPNAFTNPELLSYLEDNQVDELELVGIDGAICVFHTAKGAIGNGFMTSIDLSCVASANDKRFHSKVEELKRLGIKLKGDDRNV